jgi:diguanylate cyclase (GGDEF)-like protein
MDEKEIKIYHRELEDKDFEHFYYFWTICEAIAAIVLLCIYNHYETPFLIQTLGIMVIISIIHILPNRWSIALIISSAITLIFFTTWILKLDLVSDKEFKASIFYTLIILILNAVSSYRFQYFKRIQHLHKEELLKLSMTDPLTGINNRAKFEQELDKWFEIFRKYQSPLSLIIFDIDNFKNINDIYGHLAGDSVIITLTKTIQELIRRTDIFARWGGDEFVILLPNTSKKDAIDLAERIREKVDKSLAESSERFSCSFGVVSAKKNDNIKSIIKRADEKLYQAKKLGKNIVSK